MIRATQNKLLMKCLLIGRLKRRLLKKQRKGEKPKKRRKLNEQEKKARGGDEREVMIDVIETDTKTDIEGIATRMIYMMSCDGMIGLSGIRWYTPSYSCLGNLHGNMDAIRKQLDVLMGANRNGDVREVNRKYYDRDVCRLYLVGLCPHELFQLTKMDMGPCPKVHSLQLRKEYGEAKAKGINNYDRELEDVIDKLIGECDRKIGRALKRLEDEDAKAAIAISVSDVTQTSEVIELSKQIEEKLKEADDYDLEGKTDLKVRALEVVEELRTKRADKQSMLLLDAFNKDRASLPQPTPNAPPLAPIPIVTPDPRMQEMINEKLKKAEDLGEQGMVDEAQKVLEEAEALKKLPARQEPVLDSSKYTAADVRITDQKLRVCDICGAFLSVYDSDRRLADHFGGKLHLGYMQIREKLAELQGERNKSRHRDRNDDRRSKERNRESSRDREGGDSVESGRVYDRRSRDRDRYYDRDRGYDRDSDRRSRSHRRSRSRDYDRRRYI